MGALLRCTLAVLRERALYAATGERAVMLGAAPRSLWSRESVVMHETVKRAGVPPGLSASAPPALLTVSREDATCPRDGALAPNDGSFHRRGRGVAEGLGKRPSLAHPASGMGLGPGSSSSTPWSTALGPPRSSPAGSSRPRAAAIAGGCVFAIDW